MIYYVTGNESKVGVAKLYLSKFGVEIEGKALKLREEQTDSVEEIALSKAKQAFKILKKPLIVSDSGWYIKSLGGFPGLFMKYINEWFKAEDFIKLMQGQKDKTVILKEALCYIDKNRFKVFVQEIEGEVLEKAYGKGLPSDRIISLSKTGISIAESNEKGIRSVDNQPIWEEFWNWYKRIINGKQVVK